MEIMRKNLTLVATVVVGILLSCGCASTPKHDLTRMQGTWVGEETGGPKGECRMTVEGATLKFQGARAEEWYVATLTLNPKAQPKQAMVRIGDCPVPKYVNQTAKAIYKLEGKTLTIAAHEPGDEAVPTTFELSAGSRMRAFVFTRQ
jgi:uncharacterized protein (TIGR03067 family)